MIGIVVLNYNSWEETYKCVSSILESKIESDFKIYIVDNNSDKHPDEFFLSNVNNDNRIELIFSKDNRGYSAGNNIGIKKAKIDGCKYIMISNNDIYYESTTIDDLKNFLEENKDYSLVGPKIYLPNGDVQEINMVVETRLIDKYKYVLRKTPLKFLSKGYVDKFQKKSINLPDFFEVNALSGCCFMMNERAVEILTPFDEEFFLFYEEYVIGTLSKLHNLKAAYFTLTSILHEHSKSTSKIGYKSYIYFVKSEVLYFRKYRDNSIISIFPLYLIRNISFIFKIIFRKNFFINLKLFYKETLKSFKKKKERE